MRRPKRWIWPRHALEGLTPTHKGEQRFTQGAWKLRWKSGVVKNDGIFVPLGFEVFRPRCSKVECRKRSHSGTPKRSFSRQYFGRLHPHWIRVTCKIKPTLLSSTNPVELGIILYFATHAYFFNPSITSVKKTNGVSCVLCNVRRKQPNSYATYWTTVWLQVVWCLGAQILWLVTQRKKAEAGSTRKQGN